MAITSNVLNQEQTLEEIKNTLNFLSNTLSMTLGPYGSTTIVQDRMLQHFMTKDGYSVLKQIKVKEDLPRTIIDIVKGISRNLVRTVGDGSTSSIVISNSLFTELKNFIETYKVPPKDLIDMLNEVSIYLSNEIKKNSKKIDESMIKLEDIATISTNNDKESGKLIKEIFSTIGPHGMITIEDSQSKDDYYEVTNGFEIPRGYINYLFTNSEDKKTCTFENPLIFMCNERLNESDLPMLADLIGEACLTLGGSLVLIAKEYDGYVKTFLHENKMANKGLQICAIDISVNSEESARKFNDIAIMLGVEPYNKMENEKVEKFSFSRLGKCSKVIIDDSNSRFIEGNGNPKKIKERFELVLKEYNKLSQINDHIDRDEDLYELKKRMAQLSGAMAILYVGGETEVERNTRKFLIEDAVYACQSAIKHGYIIGGNLAIPRILNSEKKFEEIKLVLKNKFSHLNEFEIPDDVYDLDGVFKALLDSLFYSFLDSFKKVLENAKISYQEIEEILANCIDIEEKIFNVKTRKYETIEETSIINSAETDIEILKASLSIIGLLVTSNQFLSINTF
jgi:chaperonin GroEL